MSQSRILRTPQARLDLVEQYEYLGDGDPELAERFLDKVEETLSRLATYPQSGAIRPSSTPEVSGLRFFPIDSFPQHLVFYKPIADGIEVLRVLHGARDLPPLLDEG